MARSTLSGALLVNKPQGISSNDVVLRLKWALKQKTGLKNRELPKLGHGGTLDPFATGLLVILVGEATKLANTFLHGDKSYQAVLRFGETTLSGDLTNRISGSTDATPFNLFDIQAAAKEFQTKTYLQTPPMHSAKKFGGKKLYELAREGKTVEREAIHCFLHELDFFEYQDRYAQFHVKCGAGTYIRTLAQDFAASMGSLGMLDELCRTQSGQFSLNHAWNLAEITQQTRLGADWQDMSWIPLNQLLSHLPRAEVTQTEVTEFNQGEQRSLTNVVLRSGQVGCKTTLPLYFQDELIAIASQKTQGWTLDRVFALT